MKETKVRRKDGKFCFIGLIELSLFPISKNKKRKKEREWGVKAMGRWGDKVAADNPAP